MFFYGNTVLMFCDSHNYVLFAHANMYLWALVGSFFGILFSLEIPVFPLNARPILVFCFHLEMEVPMPEKFEGCLTYFIYNCILHFCGPTQKIPLVKRCILSSNEADNSCPSTWFPIEVSPNWLMWLSGAHRKLHDVRYSTWGAVGQIITVQLLNLHQK